MNTAAHTHRFDDNGNCTRCGRSLQEVHAEREAAATQTATRKPLNDLQAVAAENDARERKVNRQEYYYRTGR